MPDYFSHLIIAEKIYDRLPEHIRTAISPHELYLLGAQGGDVFFFYRAVPGKTNVGRKLHNADAKEIFSKLSEGDFTYAAGFATHYALDCTLHPAVYAFADSHRRPFAHQSFEDDLGLYISKKYNLRRQILPREKLLGCTYPVYESARLLDGEITVAGTERCLKRFFAYTKRLYAHKRGAYKNDYDFSSLSEKTDESIELGVRAVECLYEGRTDDETFSKKFLQR